MIQISSHFYQPFKFQWIFFISKQVIHSGSFFHVLVYDRIESEKTGSKLSQLSYDQKIIMQKKDWCSFTSNCFLDVHGFPTTKIKHDDGAGMICRPAFEISPKQSTNINLCCGIFQDPPTRPFTKIPVLTLNYLLKWFGNPYENMLFACFKKGYLPR